MTREEKINLVKDSITKIGVPKLLDDLIESDESTSMVPSHSSDVYSISESINADGSFYYTGSNVETLSTPCCAKVSYTTGLNHGDLRKEGDKYIICTIKDSEIIELNGYKGESDNSYYWTLADESKYEQITSPICIRHNTIFYKEDGIFKMIPDEIEEHLTSYSTKWIAEATSTGASYGGKAKTYKILIKDGNEWKMNIKVYVPNEDKVDPDDPNEGNAEEKFRQCITDQTYMLLKWTDEIEDTHAPSLIEWFNSHDVYNLSI